MNSTVLSVVVLDRGHTRTRRLLACAAGACVLAGAAAPASAYLGSFAPADGYNFGLIQPWVDVSYFNAGANGANAGGGAWGHIPADSGLWKVVGPVGGIYTSTAARNAAITADPTYLNPPSAAGNGTVYIVGDHSPGRADNSSLAFRNSTPAGTGMASYDYTIDTYDTGGTVPASITGGTVSMQMYMLASPLVASTPGTAARDKFIMSLKDSSSNIGMQWGYAEDNQFYWRTNTSGPWNYTTTYVSSGFWDGVKVDIDLTADTFKMSYYIASSSTWFTMVGSTALGTPMTNLTNLGWQLADDINLGVGGINFFDDASFVIPAPGTGALGLLGLALLRRRR